MNDKYISAGSTEDPVVEAAMAWQDIGYEISIDAEAASRRRRRLLVRLSRSCCETSLARCLQAPCLPSWDHRGPASQRCWTSFRTQEAYIGRLLTPEQCRRPKHFLYVEQEDALLGVLTVRETIWYFGQAFAAAVDHTSRAR